MNLFNHSNDDITKGIESTIWKSIEKSIENDNIETFNVLNKFVVNVLYLSINNNSIEHFKKYIIFPASYYFITFQKIKENFKFQKLHKHATEYAALELKEIITFSLRYNENDIAEKKYESLKINNLFLYNAFNGFNRLLYLIISNGDTLRFDYAINEFFLIDQLRYNNFNDLKNEIRYNFRNESPEELELKKELYNEVKYFDEYKRHVIIGLRYWSLYLYAVKKNDLDTTIKYLEGLRIHSDFQEMLKDIIYLRNHPKYDYFEWGSWDYKERPNGRVYSPPNPRYWLTFGFLIDLLKSENPYLNSQFLSLKEMSEINFFYDTIKEDAQSIIKHYDFWKPILKVNEIEHLERKIDNILNSLKNLKRESINAKDISIANEELSAQKIEEFKNLIWESWNNFSTIRKLFLKEKNIELIDSDVKFIGQKTFFHKAKKMFIDGENFQQIYNVGEIGGQTSRWIDDEFLDEVITNKKDYIENVNLIDSINNCLQYLEEKEINATTILVSPEYSYRNDGFLYNKDFISKHDIKERNEDELTKYFIGNYKNLNVYIVHSDYILNKVIVSDFDNAFKMKYKTNPDWYNSELKINVNPITDEEAEKRYNSNPKQWITRDDGIDLTKEEALVLIKNGIHLEIGSYNEFEIINPEAYAVGLIQNKIQE
ncbi:hypothetical protein [Flavobacterium macrobrachii]|uniref:Uncharacterized protein n=1 Tax=Flavobacterium macrobrachii TaxID=591204 RepID=A0ABS2CVI7_9FLAO|nr:hypothetical protein [Flavobacterium macrobrachii]MBM6498931.1 hypothetical protein [Flavobacterium macrobrachii]